MAGIPASHRYCLDADNYRVYYIVSGHVYITPSSVLQASSYGVSVTKSGCRLGLLPVLNWHLCLLSPEPTVCPSKCSAAGQCCS
jgi:hypothetical protein